MHIVTIMTLYIVSLIQVLSFLGEEALIRYIISRYFPSNILLTFELAQIRLQIMYCCIKHVCMYVCIAICVSCDSS